jgi:hypothetical protein
VACDGEFKVSVGISVIMGAKLTYPEGSGIRNWVGVKIKAGQNP